MQEKCSFLIGIPSETQWSIGSQFSRGSAQLFVTCSARGNQSIIAEAKQWIEELKRWMETDISYDGARVYLSAIQINANISFALLYSDGDTVICCAKQGTIHLQRAGSVLPLLEESPNFACIQGTLYAEDRLFFGTEEFSSQYLPNLESSADPYESLQKMSGIQENVSSPLVCGGVWYHQDKQPDLPLVAVKTLPPVAPPKPPRSTFAHRPMSFRFPRGRVSPKYIRIGIVLGILIFAIVGIDRLVVGNRTSRIESAVAPLESRYTQIMADQSSSRLAKEQLLTELTKDIHVAEETYAKDPAIQARIGGLQTKVEAEYAIVSKQKHIDHLTIFYDFRLVTADLVASEVALDIPGKLAVFLDAGKKRLVSLSLEKKQPQTVTISDDIGSAISLSVIERKAYVLGTKGVYEVSLPLDTLGKTAITASSLWQNPKQIANFSDNLYVFDSGARQIFRYDRTDPGASPSAWLRSKEGVDIDQISSLAIDGDVWMGTTGGKIYKFTRGDRVSFGLQDITSAPSSLIALYTTENSTKLYVLEPRQKRLLIFEKSGQYVSSVVSDDLATAVGLVVDEDANTAYVLAGSIVFAVPL